MNRDELSIEAAAKAIELLDPVKRDVAAYLMGERDTLPAALLAVPELTSRAELEKQKLLAAARKKP